MNALTTTTGTTVANTSTADPWAIALAAAGGTTGKFLKFDGNTGDFLYGPENDQQELKHGSRCVIDMTSYAQGFICWKDQEVVEELMDAVMINPSGPNKSTLTDHGPYEAKRDGWKAQTAFNLLDGETESLFNFKTSSGGGRRGCKSFLESFIKEYRKHPGKFPVVELGVTKFDTKDEDGKAAGKKYAPVFNIVDWFSQTDYEAMATAANEEGADPDAGSEDSSNYQQEEPAVQKQPDPTPEPPPVVKTTTEQPATGRRAKRF